MKVRIYRCYPAWIVMLASLLSLSIYAIGAYIMFRAGLVWLILYLLYIIVLELRLLRGHCVNCCYHDGTCAFGKGRLSGLLFKKGDRKKFTDAKITWKDIIPDFMVTLFPVIAAMVMLISNFEWVLLVLLSMLVVLGFPAIGMVRGKLSCPHCKQRILGCPAEQLFSKKGG